MPDARNIHTRRHMGHRGTIRLLSPQLPPRTVHEPSNHHLLEFAHVFKPLRKNKLGVCTFLLAAAAEATALACISVISGYTTDKRQPRKPSMGLTSCSWATRSFTTARDFPTVSARACPKGFHKSGRGGGGEECAQFHACTAVSSIR